MRLLLIAMWLLVDVIQLPEIGVVSVGNGVNCHYHPDQLALAIQKHRQLYLTNEFIIQSLELTASDSHLIGGFSNCDDIFNGTLSNKRTQVTGRGETFALQVNTPHSELIQPLILENFEFINGWSTSAGGIEINSNVSLKLINNLIHHNYSTGSGGGIHIKGDGVHVDLINTEIYNNVAQFHGGGVAVSGAYNTINLYDSKIFANQAWLSGGGVDCKNINAINIMGVAAGSGQTTVVDNQANVGQQLMLDLSCQILITNDQRETFLPIE